MRTVDQVHIRAPLERVYDAAAAVERWPAILSHYRWVRRLEGSLVEMAAWRPFGPLRYPTWWVSEMTLDRAAGEIRYRHVRGITRGMKVTWRMVEVGGGDRGREGGVDVEIVHTWDGPAWPLIGRLAADLVIGPVFIHGIASRTLAGIKTEVEERG
jgi:coenzyme Q-binding protein COQ10